MSIEKDDLFGILDQIEDDSSTGIESCKNDAPDLRQFWLGYQAAGRMIRQLLEKT